MTEIKSDEGKIPFTKEGVIRDTLSIVAEAAKSDDPLDMRAAILFAQKINKIVEDVEKDEEKD